MDYRVEFKCSNVDFPFYWRPRISRTGSSREIRWGRGYVTINWWRH